MFKRTRWLESKQGTTLCSSLQLVGHLLYALLSVLHTLSEVKFNSHCSKSPMDLLVKGCYSLAKCSFSGGGIRCLQKSPWNITEGHLLSIIKSISQKASAPPIHSSGGYIDLCSVFWDVQITTVIQ